LGRYLGDGRIANGPARALRSQRMPYDAFISYCSEDKKVADAVCGTLEANKIRCWIAPRDIGPGRTGAPPLSKGSGIARSWW
jgi:hypothetical protein